MLPCVRSDMVAHTLAPEHGPLNAHAHRSSISKEWQKQQGLRTVEHKTTCRMHQKGERFAPKRISTGAPNIVAGSSVGTTLLGPPAEASFVMGGPSHTGEPNKPPPYCFSHIKAFHKFEQ